MTAREAPRDNWAAPLAALLGLLYLVQQFICCIPTVDGFFIDSRQSPHANQWSYAEQFEWARRHRDCSQRAQSPINIEHESVIMNQHLRLHFYNYNKPLRFRLSNAHHTIKLDPVLERTRGHEASDEHNASSPSLHDVITADEYVKFTQAPGHQDAAAHSGRLRLPPNSGLQANASREHPGTSYDASAHENESEPYGGAPTIKLDWLDDGNNEFKLRDIHFHWGERRDNGSEHAIDGRRAAMEMHLVHIKHGLDKSAIGFTSDSVAVVAILIESHRKSNADFNPIVNELVRVNATDEPQDIDYKSIYDLLPANLNAFYTYSGSLTTPPCYQVVNWIVMAERLNMNAKQIEMFRQLYAAGAHQHEHAANLQDGDQLELIVPNVRSLQPLNNRTILASFTKYGSQIETTAWSAAAPNINHHCLYLLHLTGLAASIIVASLH